MGVFRRSCVRPCFAHRHRYASQVSCQRLLEIPPLPFPPAIGANCSFPCCDWKQPSALAVWINLSTLQLSQAALSSLKACSKPRGNRRKNCEAGGFSSLTPYLFLMTHPTFIGSFCLSPSFCLSSHQRLLSGLRWHLPFSRRDPCFPALLPRCLSNSSPTENASSFISSLS